jgi:hypothetical protein
MFRLTVVVKQTTAVNESQTARIKQTTAINE